jgi:sulfite oxidase
MCTDVPLPGGLVISMWPPSGRSPFNAEPPASVLAGGEMTALDAFYSRNHGPFPTLPEQWRLTVDGMADKPLTATYDELTAGFTGLNR